MKDYDGTMSETMKRRYHHGNLRRALLDEALAVISEQGPAGVSLRELARRLGVSHAAPAHHFGDKRALLTAIAVEGYDLLAEELEKSAEAGFAELGIAYVRFAVEHPAHIQVMFQPSLLREEDEALDASRRRTGSMLYSGAGTLSTDDRAAVGAAGWCLMHGLALLWLGGNLRDFAPDAIEAARRLTRVVFRPLS
jgi:AcrR family transcriptional regulator